MKLTLRLILPGLLIWVIPFLVGFFFYDANGKLATDIFLFKSVMIITLVVVVSYASIRSFRRVDSNYTKHALISGLVWMALLLLLDIVILIPMSGMTGQEYIFQIGLRYLIVPIISTTYGYAATNAAGS